MPDGASQPFKPLFFELLLLNPLSDVESKAAMTPSEEHVGGRAMGSRIARNDVGNMCKRSDKASLGGEVVSSEGFELCFIVFE